MIHHNGDITFIVIFKESGACNGEKCFGRSNFDIFKRRPPPLKCIIILHNIKF